MSKKILDWNKINQSNFDDRRREALGIDTGKQRFAKAFERLEAQKEQAELTKAMEPLCKAKLLEYMTEKKPIRVLSPFSNPTETLGGILKSENTEEDDFYYNGGSQRQDASLKTANATFQEVMETIPAGIELMFKGLDKQLGQFIFDGSDGNEYAIYTKPKVMFQKNWINNPGYYGLLFNTEIKNQIGE